MTSLANAKRASIYLALATILFTMTGNCRSVFDSGGSDEKLRNVVPCGGTRVCVWGRRQRNNFGAAASAACTTSGICGRTNTRQRTIC